MRAWSSPVRSGAAVHCGSEMKVRAARGEGKPESIISTACVTCQAVFMFFASSAGSFSTRSHSSRATTCA